MKIAFKSLLAALSLVGTVSAQAPQIQWSWPYDLLPVDKGYSLVQTPDGGYLMAGASRQPGSFDWQAVLVKTDSAGAMSWIRPYGGPYNDLFTAVIPAGDGNYIVVGCHMAELLGSDDLLVMKVDGDGDTIWTRTYGGTAQDVAYTIIANPAGGFFVAGTSASIEGGSYKAWLLKLDAQGDTLWTRAFGGPGWNDGRGLALSPDSGVVVCGQSNSRGWLYRDVYFVKVDSQGNTVWERRLDNWEYAFASGIMPLPQEGFLIVGTAGTFGYQDILTSGIAESGDTLWIRTWGPGNFSGAAAAVCRTLDDKYVIVGTTYDMSRDIDNIVVLRLDANNLTWLYDIIENTRAQYGSAVAATVDGGFAVSGSTVIGGDIDYLLVKFRPRATGTTHDIDPLPQGINLAAYPNPFNPATTISYTLPVPGPVTLDIYDLLGRRIATLFEGEHPAGEHKVNWDGGGMPSGIYFARLKAGENYKMAKMVLLK